MAVTLNSFSNLKLKDNMDKLKENLFEIFLLLYSIRSFAVGPSISDALIAITLVISIVYIKNFLKKEKIEDKESLSKDIDMLKQELAKIKLDRGIKQVSGNGFTR